MSDSSLAGVASLSDDFSWPSSAGSEASFSADPSLSLGDAEPSFAGEIDFSRSDEADLFP